MQPETTLLYQILERLKRKYPQLIPSALNVFQEEWDLDSEELLKPFMNQLFLGWVYTAHRLYDGKSIIQLARQVLDLSDQEEKMLICVENCIIGYFKINGQIKNEIRLTDLFTNKEYVVTVIDLEYTFRK